MSLDKEFIIQSLFEMKNKLKGFTLMELLIVMVISSLVIMLSYQLISFFYEEYYSYRDINDRYYHWNKFEHEFSEDVFKADKVTMKSRSIILEMDGQETVYKFSNDQVVRFSDFEVVYPVSNTFFEVEFLESAKLVKSIDCSFLMNERTFHFRIDKRYDYLSIFASDE